MQSLLDAAQQLQPGHSVSAAGGDGSSACMTGIEVSTVTLDAWMHAVHQGLINI